MTDVSASGVLDADVIHVPAGGGRTFWGPGDRYTFLVTGAGTGGSCFIVHCVVPPGGGPPPHIHTGEDEFLYLLDGTLAVTVAGRSFEANTGDLINVRRGTAHTYRNDGSTNASMLAIFTPAGMEGWFAEALDPAQGEGLAPPPTPELLARMVAAGPKYGVEWA